jgi:hypothetical protein
METMAASLSTNNLEQLTVCPVPSPGGCSEIVANGTVRTVDLSSYARYHRPADVRLQPYRLKQSRKDIIALTHGILRGRIMM